MKWARKLAGFVRYWGDWYGIVNARLNLYLSLTVFTKMVHYSFIPPSEGYKIRNKVAYPLLVLSPWVVRDQGSPDNPTIGDR